MDHPISTTYLDVQTARASAVLAAAGAYDSAPTEMYCPGFRFVTLFGEYTRGGAGGKVKLKLEVSPSSSGTVWHQMSLYNQGTNVAGADTKSTLQREEVEYGSNAAAKELFTLSAYLDGNAERLRVICAESGAVGTPGTVKVTAHFSMQP
jgi:hypothetical protein